MMLCIVQLEHRTVLFARLLSGWVTSTVSCLALKDTATRYCIGSRTSGVARVTCALGQGIILRPLSTKTTEFEVKNRCNEHLL